MKKWAYLLSGILIGVLIVTSGSAVAAQVKSLVGKKVTGEYVVMVNDKTLEDMGAVIDGRANVPVRGISEALGADIKVEGKTIIVTTGISEMIQQPETAGTPMIVNPYKDWSKQELEKKKVSLQINFLAPRLKGQEEILDEIEQLKKAGATGVGDALEAKREQLAEYEGAIIKYTAELEQVEEALKTQLE